MEFFEKVSIKTSEKEIRERITFDNLEKLSGSMFVMNHSRNRAIVGTVWGEFTLQRDLIKNGLRFSLLQCPNAFTFTITTDHPPHQNRILIHLTVNREGVDPEFLTELTEFAADWKTGLENHFRP